MRSNAKRPEIVNTEPYFQMVKRQLSEEFRTEDITELKGDSAAHVKVSNQGLSKAAMSLGIAQTDSFFQFLSSFE